MRNRTPLLIRGLATGVMAIGLVGVTALSAGAEEICREEPLLAAVDSDGDGVASISEIRAIGPDNAQLQGLADRLEGQGITGIRYTGCDESDAGTTPGNTGDESDAGTTPGNTGDESDEGTTPGNTGDGSGSDTSSTGAGEGADGDATSGNTGDGSDSDTAPGNSAGASESGTNSGTTGTSSDTNASSVDGAETDDLLVSVLPSTGQGASAISQGVTRVTLILGGASTMALGAAVALRQRWLA